MVFGKSRNHEAVLKYARNMTENYKKRIKTIEKIEQNDIIKTIVRTIGGSYNVSERKGEGIWYST